jgi:transposase
MRNKTWRVTLTDTERTALRELIAAGEAPARKLTHARILLKADESSGGPGWSDSAITEALEISGPTVGRVRKRYVTEGLDAALNHRPPKAQRPPKLDGRQEAHLIALACSDPPPGHARWTLRLLADKMVELEFIDYVSHVTVWQTLKKTNSSRGGASSGVFRPKRAANLSGTWRTSSMCTVAPTIRAVP